MTKWLLKRYPQFEYTVADLAVASTLPFVRYRFRGLPVRILEIDLGKEGLPLRGEYDFIACVDVLEHCLDPLMVVEHLYTHLATHGILYLDFHFEPSYLQSDHHSENLRAAALMRDTVIDFLESNLLCIKTMQHLEPGQDARMRWNAAVICRKV